MKKTKLTDFPEWEESTKKLNELKLERDTLERDYNAGLLQVRDRETKQRRLTEAAEHLIKGGDGKVKPVLSENDLEDLAERRRVISRAIELQEKHVQGLLSRLSSEICKTIRPEYVAIVRDMATAVARLQNIAQKERLFRESMRDAGIQFITHIQPCVLRGFGESDSYGRAAMFFREAVATGYLREEDVEVIQ